MRAARKFVFLTLVEIMICSLAPSYAHANPHYDAASRVRSDENVEKAPNPESAENLSVGQVPQRTNRVDDYAARRSRRNYYYAYRQELDLHAGVVFGFQDSSDDEDLMNGLVGFSYVAPSLQSRRWVFGADLATVGYGHLHISKRKTYNEKGSIRPYYDLGLMQKLVPDEKLASFSNWDNYLFRIGIGFGTLMTPPKSSKLDLHLAVGKEDVLLLFTYGHAWGF